MPNNMILLETIALTQSAASVTFDNLPTSGYTDLKIVVSARNSAGGSTEGIFVQMNSVATGYSNRVLFGNGSTAASGNNSYGITSKTYLGEIPTSGSTANTFGSIDVYIPNYRSSNQKSISSDAVTENNATAVITALNASLVTSTAAITSLTFTPFSSNFLANSTFSLYGIAALGTTPVLAPKATGGNIVANDGTYWYHAFTSSGNFVPQVGLTADVLVFGGGGGGSANVRGGGGGSGGGSYSSAATLTPQTYTITIGGGGASTTSTGRGNTGTSSSAIGLTGFGGGAGRRAVTDPSGANGGSGGGGDAETGYTTGGTATQGSGGTAAYGNAGGNSNPSTGGGGGGTGAVGGNATDPFGGAGGIGTDIFSTWATATGTGSSNRYAAGGGGSNASTTFPTAAAAGGGGRGAYFSSGTWKAATAATVNTGSGGGGAAQVASPGDIGGAGGSGIVIIRYPIN